MKILQLGTQEDASQFERRAMTAGLPRFLVCTGPVGFPADTF